MTLHRMAKVQESARFVGVDPLDRFGHEPIEAHSIYGPLLGSEDVAKTIVPTRRDHLWLIPGDINLAGAEIEVARAEDHLTRLRTALEPLRHDATFDFVLLDCPPSLGILMTNALAAATLHSRSQ